ncbi:MAG TPA: tyrosine-type recombinase/integrase [Gammaproteobacteria bacterium]|nr:tyrosine-type recombinase/integrase [Gammaproteobacteria bacterium]
MGRPRSAGRRDLPDNLIPHQRTTGAGAVIYWYWRDPRDGKEKTLKCPNDRATAIKRARELNAIVSREMADRVVANLAAAPAHHALQGVAFSAYALHCLTLWAGRGLADNTLRSRRSLINAAIRALGDQPLPAIGVRELARLLKRYTDQGKHRTAQSLRSTLIDLWAEAHGEGALPPQHPNPAKLTRRPKATVQRARLTLEAFATILQAANALAEHRGAWIANSHLLALVTGQRREDLAIAQFRRGRDWPAAWDAWQERREHPIHPYPHIHDDHLWLVQQKTGALVRIPLSLRLEALDLSLGDIIERCRASGVASRYLIHHTAPFGNAPRGASVHADTISRAFADARSATELTWPGKTPPTYHEIRSLSERLYKAQGIDTQALLGHRHARMTETYHDPRQAEWITI